MNTAADSPCTCSDLAPPARCEARLPDTPQCAPNYHFGMLLGVEDFRAEQGFHVGRLRRHQRLLHGSGVVAGYALHYDKKDYGLRVGPGYGIDSLGRDLSLDAARCVSLALWWDKHRKDEDFADVVSGETRFDLDIVACYGNCLDRAVPAIAEPCAGDAADIAYARICETVELRLERHADDAAPPAPDPWHLLRMWLGLDAPAKNAQGKLEAADQKLADAFAAIQALPEDQQEAARQGLLRDLLAQAAAAVSPVPPSAAGDACLLLGRLRGVKVTRQGASGWSVQVEALDAGVREVLLPTRVLQDLLLAEPPAVPAAAGPIVVPGAATLAGSTLTLVFNQRLAAASVTQGAFAVSEFDPATGWSLFSAGAAAYDESNPARPSVSLTLDRSPAGKRLRITVIGTGSTPLLGRSLIPAGALHPGSDGRNLTTTLPI